MSGQIDIRQLSKNDFPLIKPLWLKLNELHLNDSVYFRDHFETFTFEERCRHFDRFDDDTILIEAVSDKNILAGYCITTAHPRAMGEIESLFIEESYRGKGLGDRLLRNSLSWLKKHDCDKIVVAVSYGHESAFGFYQKYDLMPRMTLLELKKA